MALTNGTYFPSAGFSFPRSYVYQIDFALYGTTLTHADNIYIVHAVPPTTTFIYCEFWADWYTWNSNTYQLGDIVKDFYAETPPSPTRTHIPFDFGYWRNTTTNKIGLFLNWFTGPRLEQIVNLPTQPAGYWLPRRL